MSDRTRAFLDNLAAPQREVLRRLPDLEALLTEALRAGQRAWPRVRLSGPSLMRHLAGSLGSAAPADCEQVLRAVQFGDLYLAAACAAGNAKAVAAFTQTHVPSLKQALLRFGGASVVDESVAQTLEMLFVGVDDRPPGIASYSGRGQLRSWLRSVAIRTHRRLAGARQAPTPALDVPPPITPGPEERYAKDLYRGEFEEAIVDAFSALSPDQCTLLRQTYVEGLTVAQLGVRYGVHRSTAARWVAGARERLLDHTRQTLRTRMRLTASELDSLVRLVRSNVELSLHQLLQPPKPESGEKSLHPD